MTAASKPINSERSKFGYYAAMTIGVFAVGFSVLTIPFVLPAMRKHALPYIPATTKQVENVFKAINLYSKQNNLNYSNPSGTNLVRLIDLGSGDGRIVFDAASRGYHSTGVELNTVLYLYSKIKSIINRLKGIENASNAHFKRADFWKINMKEYDLIIVFGVQEMMKELSSKIKDEMKPNTLIVSCRHPISAYKSVFSYDDELDR